MSTFAIIFRKRFPTLDCSLTTNTFFQVFLSSKNTKNKSPRPITVPLDGCHPYLRGYRAQNQVALCANHWSSWVDMKKIVTIRSPTPPSVASEREGVASRAISERIYARKPYTSVCERPPSVTWRPTGFLDLPAPRARAVDQSVAVVVLETKASEHSTSHLSPNPLSPEAKEEILNAVACQESTRTKDFTLKAKKTEAESACCRAVLVQARSSVSRAFVHTR